MKVEAIKKNNLKDQVASQIISMVVTRELKVGNKLPSESELANMFSVSRTPLREALKMLNLMGIVKTRHGDGSFITEIPVESYMEPFKTMVRLNNEVLRDLMEIRRILEGDMVRLASLRARKEEIEEIRATLMKQIYVFEDKKREVLIQEGFRFHRTIAKATGNELLLKLLNIIGSLFIRSREEAICNWEIEKILLENHKKLFERIEARDAEGAQRAMVEHLDCLEKYCYKTC
jgi:GntR family transcriptional repressor for pyruvate dehydrogenase complex